MPKLRVLVVGIDGASWNIIDRLMSEGELPTFKHLIDNGVRGVLRSTYPPWTVPAWNSICSGLSPKKLGYATFMVPNPDYTFVPHIFRCGEPMYVWDYLSCAGLKVIVANVPCVYSPREVNGIIISGWLCVDPRKIAYPPQIIDELSSICGNYVVDIYDIDFKHGRIIRAPSQEELPRIIFKVLSKRICVFKNLLLNYDWDFAFLVFTETDRVQHNFYNNLNITRKVYKYIDRFLGWLMDVVDNNTFIFIVSDHGFSHSEQCFKINLWLLKESFLKVNWRYLSMRTIFRILDRMFTKFSKRIKHLLPIYRAIHRFHAKFEDNYIVKLIKWSETRVFAYGVWGSLYVNVRGKFAEGVIDPKVYRRVVLELVERLKNYIPSVKVLTKVEAYNDTDIFDYLPDIIIVPTDEGVQCIDPDISLLDVIKSKMFVRRVCGEHRLDGIFIGYGPGIKKGYRISEPVNVCDITPTILHLYGLPIPSNMDGKVLTDIFEPSSEFVKRKPRYVDLSYYVKLKLAMKIKRIRELKLLTFKEYYL